MNAFLGFVKKEFFHIFRDPRTLLVLFGIPIAQLLIFGFVVNNEIKNIKIAIYDPSKDAITLEISNKIISSGYFILEENLQSATNIETIFKKGDVKQIVVFEPGFANKLEKEGSANVQIIADASDANTANLIVNYTSAIITDYITKKNETEGKPMHIVPITRMVYNEGLKSVYMFVPGTMALILMLVSAMMTSISIAREKEMGTMEVLLVSPLKPPQIIIGKVIPYVVLAFVNAVSIISLGYFVFGMPVKGSLPLLLAESFLFITLALSLGILISTMAKTQQVAMFISMFALMLPTLLLSGFIFPIENMPIILQGIAHLMPPKYFIIIIKNIMLKGTGMAFIWKETLILIGMTLLFIMISIKKFKIRLD
ncbi:MAG: ABC transporter permease [Bacteroidales bacterium]|nr:ABC transporter permease [Bacteroidales bacterium]MCF8403537.1 ABC transporter permease [Bacteroidales bacterium]